MAVHPQEQVGRLTSRLPILSGRIVMLWVTLLIFLPLPGDLYTRSTTDVVVPLTVGCRGRAERLLRLFPLAEDVCYRLSKDNDQFPEISRFHPVV